ncbi:thioesterase II family protein [Nisaea sp.]|uniref:thioesterase II family protein n=1 Tax=Nisaea sp. TaxID=2024842 RepID=UPI003B51FAF3
MHRQARPLAAATPWLPVQRRAGPGADTAPVLICFPPAGAGAGFFRDWPDGLPDIRIVPVQLPGREERFSETAEVDVFAIASEVSEAIAREGWDRPILLGYSYGALLAFETALLLERSGHEIAGVITLARAAPQTEPQRSVADLHDGAFLDYVRSLGGLPPEFDDMPELADLLLPTMRTDFRANDGYARAANARLRCPIVTISGTADQATAGDRDAAWAARSEADHRLIRIEGGHFFIHESPGTAFTRIADVIVSLNDMGRSGRP